MKRYLLTITIIFICTTNFSFLNPKGDITIEINNLRNSDGAVLISLFNDEDNFPGNAEKAIGKAKAEIIKGTATATFKDISFGAYAVAILHDENKNLKMDFNFLGIPKEGYGFSNDAKGLFGPPAFNKAAFLIDSNFKKIKIKATYF
jgi:uncharacterized protein (DUF2141 family)